MRKRRVLIVDDHPIARTGLRTIVSGDPRLEVVGEAGDGEEACVRAEALQPDVVIMDVSMPTRNGADATRCLLQTSPASAVVAVTAHDEPPYVRELLEAGARGYVLKRAVLENLLRAIEIVAEGGVFLDPALATLPKRRSSPHEGAMSAELSGREVEVASMAALGYSNSEIATTLRLSTKTIETHKLRLMTKLGLDTRAQLVRYALYRGWLKTQFMSPL